MSVSVDADSYYCLGSITLAQTCSHRCHGIRPRNEKGKKNRVTTERAGNPDSYSHFSFVVLFSLVCEER